MQQKLAQNFFATTSGGFGNNIGKEPQKSTPKIEKYFCKHLLIL